MRKSKFKILALTAALIMPLSSCKETIIYVTPEDIPNDDIKTPIELSVGGVDGAVESSTTRAVITDETTDKSFNPLPAGSYIYMWMKSDYNQLADPNDYKGDQTIKYSVTRGQAVATTDNKTNGVEFTDTRIRYWDDAHARCSNLSILAVACPDLTYLGGTGTQLDDSKNPFTTSNLKPWSTEDLSSKTEIEWNIPHYTLTNEQYFNATNIKNRDLCFSNNIANYTSASKTDRRLKFNTGTKKFDKGKLVFYHALSKITVNIKIGNGFTGNNDFKFTTSSNTNENVFLQHFNIWGKFNVASGEWTAVNNDHQVIRGMYNKTGNTPNTTNQEKPAYELEALVIPYLSTDTKATKGSYLNDDATTKAIVFSIDNNTFEISRATLLNALKEKEGNGIASNATEVPLEAGKNYIFTFVVGKTKIEHLTATVAQWEDVEAATVEPKINVTATYGYTVAQGGTGVSSFTNNYDLFRSTTKATGYDEDANSENGINPAARYTSSSWDKTIYWPDHQTHYFFRGVYPQVGTAVSGTTIVGAEAVTTANGNDIVAVANAKYTAATYPSDLAIAIPRGTTTGTYDETCKETGHTAQEGICATEGVINMNFEYAMSKVEVRLKSSKTDAAHIALTKDNTKVEIIGAYSKARIKLSDGLHDAYVDDDKGDYTLSNLTTAETGSLVTTRDAIAPQVIDNDVLFRITVTTGDNGTPSDPSDDPTDVYECKVNLINVKNSSPATPVTEWVHGKHYIYELDLNKTDIKVTATITNWETVNASGNIWF